MQEITPKQLRGLLLLLVLLPLIPTALMLRFMIDTVEQERTAARERVSAVYQRMLSTANAAFTKERAGKPEPTPRDAHKFFRDLMDRSVVVRLLGNDGSVLTGATIPRGAPIAQASLRDAGVPWIIQLYLLDTDALNAPVREQFRIYQWIVGFILIAIFTVAAAAALAVHRQITLREMKNTAVATVAHELRTPLASMRMLVDTLRDGRYRSESQLREYLDLIAQENQRLNRVAENFLTLSRLERGQHRLELAPESPGAIAESAVALLRSRLEAPGCHFALQADEPLPLIHADRDALITILTNLLENALKYTNEEKEISLAIRREGREVVFDISDNGIGVEKSEQKAIFEAFHQVDQKLSRTREGCGLGLSIVRKLVDAHHGRINVRSTPGQGSTFSVRIPVWESAAATKSSAGAGLEEARQATS